MHHVYMNSVHKEKEYTMYYVYKSDWSALGVVNA